MTLIDPKDRTQKGSQMQAELLGALPSEPETLFESSWRDYVFAEVWTRPGLDRRSRYWIAMAGAATMGREPEVLEGYVRGALKSREITLPELREAVLHHAVYAGWQVARFFDQCVSRVAEDLGLPPASFDPLRKDPWDPQVRDAEGAEYYEYIMVRPPPPPFSAFFLGGIRGFVFAEMWNRPGLDKRARRWITLVGVADSSSQVPIQTHVWAAMKSGDATPEEMQEFVLQYAIQSGWPMASFLQQTVMQLGKCIREDQPYPYAL